MGALVSKLVSNMESPPSKPSFLSLPPEIRIMIYREIFASMPDPHDVTTAKLMEPTSLFQVCRRIRSEADEEYFLSLRKWQNDLVDEREDMPPIRDIVDVSTHPSVMDAFADIRAWHAECTVAMDWARKHYRARALIIALKWRLLERMGAVPTW